MDQEQKLDENVYKEQLLSQLTVESVTR